MAPWILLALLGLGVPPPPATAEAEVHAVWLSYPWWRLPKAQKETLASYLAEKGVNRVYLSVYDEGRMRWAGTALAKAGHAEPGDDAPLLESVGLFRARGIEPVAFFEWGLAVSQDAPAARERPGLFQRCGDGVASGEHGGRLMFFLDPSQDEAMAPVLGALEELARHPAGFREIQLDRFRYTHVGWKTCTGKDGTSSPAHVGQAVAAAYRRIKAANPGVTVSASPVGSYGFWKHNQRWGEWVRDGHVDAIATQAYITPVDAAAGRPLVVERGGTGRRAGASLANAAVAKATHSSGQKLSDVADIAIDNCVAPEDSQVDVGRPEKVAAGSTMAVVYVAMTLVAETGARLVAKGHQPTAVGHLPGRGRLGPAAGAGPRGPAIPGRVRPSVAGHCRTQGPQRRPRGVELVGTSSRPALRSPAASVRSPPSKDASVPR